VRVHTVSGRDLVTLCVLKYGFAAPVKPHAAPFLCDFILFVNAPTLIYNAFTDVFEICAP